MARRSRHRASRHVTPKSEANQRSEPVAQWLRAGAVAAGMGAAMAMGAGVASADADGGSSSTSTGSESSSAGPSASSNASSAAANDQPDDTASPDTKSDANRDADVTARPGTPRIRTSVSAQGTVRTPANHDTSEAKPAALDTATESAAEVDTTSDDPGQSDDQVAIPDEVDADLIDELSVAEAVEEPRGSSAPKSNSSPAPLSIRSEITAAALSVTADALSGVVTESDSTPIAEAPDEVLAPVSASSTAAVAAVPTTTEAAAQTEPAYPPAITAPVTWRAMVSDVLRWFGLPELSAESPIPPVAVPVPLDLMWIALRRFEYRFFNDYPTAQLGQVSQNPNTGAVTGSLNATDPDGDVISYTVVGAPTSGTVVINADGTYVYTPSAAFAHAGGTDTFAVVVDDAAGNPWHVHGLAGQLGLTGPQTVTVTVTVTPIVNGAPSIPPVIQAPNPDSAGVVTGTLSGADPNGDTLSYTVTAMPTKGFLAIASDGTYVYTPSDAAQHAAAAENADEATKADSFTVTISDGYGGSATTIVSVVIAPANALPTLTPGIVLHEDSHIVLSQSMGSDGFLWTSYGSLSIFEITPNADDRDGDDVVVTVTNENPAVGSIVEFDGKYYYVPAVASLPFQLDYPTDAVTITVTDGHGGVQQTTEIITIRSRTYFTATGTLNISVGGSGATATDSAGGVLDLGGGLVIGGGAVYLGLSESGNDIEVTGLNSPPIFLPVVTEQGNVPWSVSESDTTVAVYANGSLAAFFYLGPAN